MDPTIRRPHDEPTADFRFDLDGKAKEILPAEFGRPQRLPHFFGRGGDVNGVDGIGSEIADVEHQLASSIFNAANGTSSVRPVSSMLFRLDRMRYAAWPERPKPKMNNATRKHARTTRQPG